MHEYSLSELSAKRDAIDKRIANHEPLSLPVAIKKVHAYATEHDMTVDDLFPPRIDQNADPYAITVDDSWYDPDYVPFPEFHYRDTFGYTFIEGLKKQRAELHTEICAIRRETIGRARAFIREYKLTKEDISPVLATQINATEPCLLAPQR